MDAMGGIVHKFVSLDRLKEADSPTMAGVCHRVSWFSQQFGNKQATRASYSLNSLIVIDP
jgi:hypothetical protein